MALVAPFKALRYNAEKVSLEKVVTPPYDVISPEQQDAYYQADPHNIIRLDLNKQRDSDTAEDNTYTRAAANLKQWMAQEVIKRDAAAGFYPLTTRFTDPEGEEHVRHGFLTLLKAVDYSLGGVLPHEKTFSGTKEDRLNLLKAVSTNLSPIFALYPDDDNLVQRTLEAAKRTPELVDMTDPLDMVQRMSVVDDPEVCAEVVRLMADKVIFIADGHHRYETAQNYRAYMRRRYPQAPDNASFNYVMVYLCSMSDPGLTTLGCHRLIHHLHGFNSRDFLALAEPYFDASEVPFDGDPEAARRRFIKQLTDNWRKAPSFGLVTSGDQAFHLLTLKPGVAEQEPLANIPGPMRALDAEVLTHVVLEHILGLDNHARDREHLIAYRSDTAGVVSDVLSGKARLAFLMNPTPVDQVQSVAEAGLIMPRKSTYFYPKVLTGLTMNLIDPAETIEAGRG